MARYVHSVRSLRMKCPSNLKDRSFGSTNDSNKKKPNGPRSVSELKKKKTGESRDQDETEKFPFSKLNDDHFKQMSRLIENPFRRALVAGHRPLFVMDPTMGEERKTVSSSIVENLTKPMAVPNGIVRVKGSNPLQDDFVELPLPVISRLGPFDPSGLTINSSLQQDLPRHNVGDGSEGSGLNLDTMNFIRTSIFSALDKLSDLGEDWVLVAKIASSDGQLSSVNLKEIVHWLNDCFQDQPVVVEEDVPYVPKTLRQRLIHRQVVAGRSPPVMVNSVRRKRKLKMNRHKYKKRRKEQKALRKRLGK